MINIRVAEVTNKNNDFLSFRYAIKDENIETPFEIWEGIVIPVGKYSFDRYCLFLSTAEHRKLTISPYYCGGEFYTGKMRSPGISGTWRPSPHFALALGYFVSDVELPQGDFTTRLATLRANVAFTSAWAWENFLQYDNESYTLGLNSILRWMPRAGREALFVVNRVFADYTRDRSFTSVTGDVTFKFSYTFRF